MAEEAGISRPFAVFRVDASATIGSGHWVRSMALAQSLQAAGWRCGWATREPAFSVGARSIGHGLDVLDIGGVAEEDEAAAMAAHWPDGADVLVVDHYGRGRTFETACRPWAKRILVCDDAPNRHHDCDLLLDPGSPDSAAPYRALVPPGCRLLLGPAHALVRPQFLAARTNALRRRRVSSGLRRILIYFGTDIKATATTSALSAVARSQLAAAVDVVVNADAAHLSKLRSLAQQARQRVTVHTSVADMAALMAAADLAFGAPGSASWERACLGLPSIVTVLADNQRANAALLTQAEAAVVAGGSNLASLFAYCLKELAADPARLTALSAAAARLCDGRGGLRVMLALLPDAHARDGRPVTLRPVVEDDARRIFDWQQCDATRRFAHNPEKPTWRQHREWLDAALADADRITLMIEHGGAPAGVLRLDTKDVDNRERIVSILTSPEKYRQGIASAALDLGRRLLPGAALRARVHPQNEASCRLFAAAGYHPIGSDEWHRPPASAPESRAT
ncbi:MAG: UDP-2,4-diacetamido-2,4,6-trideoxy-beta-L-altropyranose hydrolase [Rhodospirillales bacterium]|nr:UDP-2,4-diacetamido-2,4,6-trideoxy-beta-L-altropyranose hydrolase [Rhodospirillales bacterium]